MTDEMAEGQVHGTPGDGRVLVPFIFDGFGEPLEWVWAYPSAAAEWDARRWGRL